MDPLHRRDRPASDRRTCLSRLATGAGHGTDARRCDGPAAAAAADMPIAGIASGRTDHRQALPRPEGSDGR